MLKNATNTDTNGGAGACGRFSGNGEEFCLEHPDKQPRAWNNYLWNDSFLAQTLPDGTGASFLRHPKGERTTLNGGRRRVFVQDKSTGAFTSFPHGTVAWKWGGFSVQRIFRGCTYDIEVTNPDHVEHGGSSIFVDGQKWTGSTLPLQPGKTSKVHVVMGANHFDQDR